MSDWSPFLGLPLWVWLFVIPTALAAIARLQRSRLMPLLRRIWRVLDTVYLASGVLAAVFMVMILLLIIAQMSARWAGITFEGSTEFAGYAMAATSFFALAHAFSRGAHIRVSILLNLNSFTRMWLDAGAMLVASIIATYFARYAVKTNFLSEMLNDRTQGQDQIPEWFVSLLSMVSTAPAIRAFASSLTSSARWRSTLRFPPSAVDMVILHLVFALSSRSRADLSPCSVLTRASSAVSVRRA